MDGTGDEEEMIMSCDYCEGDYDFDVEEPDYSVGLFGYQVFLDNTKFGTHEEGCTVRTMSTEELDEIAVKISQRLAEGYNEWPY